MVLHKKRYIQRGQMLLVVILVMVVALTVGLSVLTRNIINTRITTDESDSQRAFSAAEAGIERSIQTGTSIGSPIAIGDASFQTTVVPVAGPEFLIGDGNITRYDDGVDIWLSDYQPVKYANRWTGKIGILWGEDADEPCNNAALEVIIISGTPANPVAVHKMFDPCSTRRNTNKFVDPITSGRTITIQGVSTTFSHEAQIDISSGIIARVIPLYKDAKMGARRVSGAQDLPAQGSVIEAVGKSGDTQRKIRANRPFPQVPNEFFQYLLLVRD